MRMFGGKPESGGDRHALMAFAAVFEYEVDAATAHAFEAVDER